MTTVTSIAASRTNRKGLRSWPRRIPTGVRRRASGSSLGPCSPRRFRASDDASPSGLEPWARRTSFAGRAYQLAAGLSVDPIPCDATGPPVADGPPISEGHERVQPTKAFCPRGPADRGVPPHPSSPSRRIKTHGRESPAMAGGSAPGKLILFGEHAVVFGGPAPRTAIDLRAEVYVRPHAQWLADGMSLDEPRYRYVKAAARRGWSGEPLWFEIRSMIPVGSGLGSSAPGTAPPLAALRAPGGAFGPL